MQELNGLDIGCILHSINACINIVNYITQEMRKKSQRKLSNLINWWVIDVSNLTSLIFIHPNMFVQSWNPISNQPILGFSCIIGRGYLQEYLLQSNDYMACINNISKITQSHVWVKGHQLCLEKMEVIIFEWWISICHNLALCQSLFVIIS